MNLIVNIIVIAASVLGSGMAFPQARRLVRTGSVDGVSATWIGVSIAINAWWMAYAIAASVWALLPVASVSFGLYAAMAVVYLRVVGRSAVRGLAVGVFVLGMVPLPVLLVAGWEAAGLAIGLCYGIQLAPAVVATFQTTELAGVSAGTWIISLVEAALWLAYGVIISDLALVAGGVTGVAMAATILVRLTVTGHQPFILRVA